MASGAGARTKDGDRSRGMMSSGRGDDLLETRERTERGKPKWEREPKYSGLGPGLGPAYFGPVSDRAGPGQKDTRAQLEN